MVGGRSAKAVETSQPVDDTLRRPPTAGRLRVGHTLRMTIGLRRGDAALPSFPCFYQRAIRISPPGAGVDRAGLPASEMSRLGWRASVEVNGLGRLYRPRRAFSGTRSPGPGEGESPVQDTVYPEDGFDSSPRVSYIVLPARFRRGVAQPGSAPALGAGGPQFKSGRPDTDGAHGCL